MNIKKPENPFLLVFFFLSSSIERFPLILKKYFFLLISVDELKSIHSLSSTMYDIHTWPHNVTPPPPSPELKVKQFTWSTIFLQIHEAVKNHLNAFINELLIQSRWIFQQIAMTIHKLCRRMLFLTTKLQSSRRLKFVRRL